MPALIFKKTLVLPWPRALKNLEHDDSEEAQQHKLIYVPHAALYRTYTSHTHALYTLVSLSVLTTLASNKLGIPLASDRDMDPDQQSSRLFGNQERSRPCCSKDTRHDTAAEKMTAYSENAMTQTKTLLVKDDVYVCECE